MAETKSYKRASKKLNDMTYTDYLNRLTLLARSLFKWNNLPKGITEKIIEKYLFYHGSCVFYNHPEIGLVVARCTENGLNHNDEPVTITPVFSNYIFKTPIKPLENNKECVLIRNNDKSFPTYYTINLFALRLTDIQRTIDVNISAQKTPVIVTCSDKQKFSLKQVVNQKDDNELTIYGDPNLDVNAITALKVDAPVVFDKLQIQKHSLWNECMTFLGVNNANMDKRERLVDDEVQANNEQIELSAEVMLKARELACEQINKIFGTNISVEIRKPTTAKIEGIEGVLNDDR